MPANCISICLTCMPLPPCTHLGIECAQGCRLGRALRRPAVLVPQVQQVGVALRHRPQRRPRGITGTHASIHTIASSRSRYCRADAAVPCVVLPHEVCSQLLSNFHGAKAQHVGALGVRVVLADPLLHKLELLLQRLCRHRHRHRAGQGGK
jgi:hypothetical protein